MSEDEGFFKSYELTQVKLPESIVPKCGACGLYKTCRSPKMPYSGKGKKKILIVAEAPGEEEDRQGLQLVGKSGSYLSSVLKKLGVDMRKDCWLTNAVICRPPENELKDNKIIDYCRPNLINTIKKLKPTTVIVLGGVAVKSLMYYAWSKDVDREVTRWTGWTIPSQTINAWICPTWHPAYLLRMESRVLEASFRKHLKKAITLSTNNPWPEGPPNYREQIELLYDKKSINKFLNGITSGIIAFDYETNMLKPDNKEARIISCSICWNGKRTVAFPLLPGVKQPLRDLLGNGEVLKIAQNMKFEDRWTRKVLGVQVKGWRWDTMLGTHILDCRTDITGLKFMSFIVTGQPRYDANVEAFLKDSASANTPNRVDQIPLEELLIYNGMDSLLEFILADQQMSSMGLFMIPPK